MQLPMSPLVHARSLLLAVSALALLQTAPVLAADAAKQACMGDAKRLCAADVKAMSRSRVRACLIAHMEQTSPPCHTFMVQARDAVLTGRKPDRSAQ
jgi:hypothetical protein